MATTRFVLTPENAHFPSSNAPAMSLINRRPVLLYDASTDETAYWTIAAPQGLTGALTAVVSYITYNATSGTAVWDVRIEAVTDADATDLDATTSFGSANTGSGTVPGTNGYLDQISVSVTNDDGIAAGDYVRISVMRDVDPSDTVSNDLALLAVEIREA